MQCISQCSPTINHNNYPATSFQCTPPSHRTLSINDSGHCSKRHIVNVSSIQRNLMSSYDNRKNRTTASTSTCQASNRYSNMTQSHIHIGNFYCYAIIIYLHTHILFIITSFSNLILQSTYI